MAAPQEIKDLVEKFERNIAEYRSSTFNEAQTRREFLDPLFAALGWDMDNRQGASEAYKEVLYESSLRVGSSTKAPDYAFRIGGITKFLVEAKKPSTNLEDSARSAYQLRSYAWNAHLPISILTDFDEFAIYDCRYPPKKTDRADTARLFYMSYTDYIDRWDEIASKFSKTAILRGSLDRYLVESRGKRGTKEVDDAFLETITSWREVLARNMALRNPGLSVEELNACVQATIDRIVFLRICEDRGIEEYGQLQKIAGGENIYAGLCGLFQHADARYNSGLFHFRDDGRSNPDLLSLKLLIDDSVLRMIIGDLYPPSPYNFALIPPEILGQVYEQFLGKVIRLTEGHRAKVENKPEVKKAGGVFYTPTYIVDYIVEHTVGRLLKDRTPAQVSELHILDPACGSGSFLLGAYKKLLDWHLDWYITNLAPLLDAGKAPTSAEVKKLLPIKEVPQENNSRKKISRKTKRILKIQRDRKAAASMPICRAGDVWKLTLYERKRILQNNIYGVDIDPQAVEVTKLSLLLKVLEGESHEEVQTLLRFSNERALPDLDSNIKCGNSLVGPDIYEVRTLDPEQRTRINAFDWATEFPEIMGSGGFDVVIGNPPYVRQEILGGLKEYFQSRYEVYHGIADLYAYFIERGVSLLRMGGLFSYIVSNKWMRANYGKPLRAWLKGLHIEEIVDFGDLPVFEKATTYPCILRISKEAAHERFMVTQVKTLSFSSLRDYVEQNQYEVKQLNLDDSGWALVDESTQSLLSKISASGVPLGEYVNGKVYRGILTGLNEAFVIDKATKERLILEDARSAELIKPFLAGRDIKRYQQPKSDKYLIFTRHGVNITDYPAIKQYLSQFKERLMPKPRDWKGDGWKGRKPGTYQWYEIQDTIDYYEEFEKPKIIIPAIVQSASYAFDINKIYSNDKTSIIPTDDLYLIGILNSKIADKVIHSISSTKQGGYYEYKPMYVQQIPIRTIDTSNPYDVAAHSRMVFLVDQMLSLNKRLQEARTPHEKTTLRRQIEDTDRQIDALVYELYGLTEEEIRIVEGK